MHAGYLPGGACHRSRSTLRRRPGPAIRGNADPRRGRRGPRPHAPDRRRPPQGRATSASRTSGYSTDDDAARRS